MVVMPFVMPFVMVVMPESPMFQAKRSHINSNIPRLQGGVKNKRSAGVVMALSWYCHGGELNILRLLDVI